MTTWVSFDEQDEEENQVGEDGVIDDAMALEAEPVGAGGGGLSQGGGVSAPSPCVDTCAGGVWALRPEPSGHRGDTALQSAPPCPRPQGLRVTSDTSGTSASSCTAMISFTSFRLGTRLPIIKNTDCIRSTSHMSVWGAAELPRAWMMPSWLSPGFKEIVCRSSNSILNLSAGTEANSPDPGALTVDPQMPRVSYVLSPLDGVLSHLTDRSREGQSCPLWSVCVCGEGRRVAQA